MKKLFRLFIPIALIVCIFYYLPEGIHRFNYAYKTQQTEIERNRKLYWETCDKLMLEKNREKELQKVKDSMYLWFHLRDLKIDEGHIPKTTLEKWDELYQYYFVLE